LHIGEQLPMSQVFVPFTAMQVLPQAPQWVLLVWRLVSQPLAPLPSQLPHPKSQMNEQVPPAHEASPLMLLHAILQPPQ
jgi:hypothetical protein